MTCSCRPDSCTGAKAKCMASNGATPASRMGWHGSGGGPPSSQKPSVWSTPASPCSPAWPEAQRSPTSSLYSPKTLTLGGAAGRCSPRAQVDERHLDEACFRLRFLFPPPLLTDLSWRSLQGRIAALVGVNGLR